MAMGGENGRNKQGEKRDKKRDQVIEREFGFAVRLKGQIEGSKAQRLKDRSPSSALTDQQNQKSV